MNENAQEYGAMGIDSPASPASVDAPRDLGIYSYENGTYRLWSRGEDVGVSYTDGASMAWYGPSVPTCVSGAIAEARRRAARNTKPIKEIRVQSVELPTELIGRRAWLAVELKDGPPADFIVGGACLAETHPELCVPVAAPAVGCCISPVDGAEHLRAAVPLEWVDLLEAELHRQSTCEMARFSIADIRTALARVGPPKCERCEEGRN